MIMTWYFTISLIIFAIFWLFVGYKGFPEEGNFNDPVITTCIVSLVCAFWIITLPCLSMYFLGKVIKEREESKKTANRFFDKLTVVSEENKSEDEDETLVWFESKNRFID